MLERDILIAMDKAVAKARCEAYALLEVNEIFGERVEEILRQASKMIEARLKAIARQRGRETAGGGQLSA